MSFYPPDGDITYGWKSFGRSFTLAGIVALAVSALAFCARKGLLPIHLTTADSLFAYVLSWIGSAFFVLMFLCGLGAVIISRRERGGVEVTPYGVCRFFSRSGRQDFFPRDEIAGMYARAEGGLALFDSTYTRQLVVPRSIIGYRDCVSELKALGIPVIVPARLPIGKPYKPQTWRQTIRNWLAGFLFFMAGSLLFDRHLPSLWRAAAGVVLAACLLFWIGCSRLRRK